jgi:hypothetical protein
LLFFLALSAMDEGDYDRAAALAKEKLALNRELKDIHDTTVALILSGMIALVRGDHERAADLFEGDLHLLRKLGDTESIIHCPRGLAGVAIPRGEPVRATWLWRRPKPCRRLPAPSPIRPSSLLDGSDAVESASGLRIRAPNTVVKGLVINRFVSATGNGIIALAEASGTRIEGNSHSAPTPPGKETPETASACPLSTQSTSPWGVPRPKRATSSPATNATASSSAPTAAAPATRCEAA